MYKKSIILFSVIVILILAYVTYHIIFPNSSFHKSELILEKGIKADSIVVFKSQRLLILRNHGKAINTYHVSLGKNPVGKKEVEGDKKTPEGNYVIDSKNPNTKYHCSLHISYPNESDKLNAKKLEVSPGGDIMLHGVPDYLGILENYYVNTDWTFGCIAVTNDEIDEISKCVDIGTPITINP